MRFEQHLLTERDVALLSIEKCKGFNPKERIDCKLKQYDEYLRQIKAALRTARSEAERAALKKSEEWAKKVQFNLRTAKQAKAKMKT